ncbi:MAG: hypothetical protein KBD53_05700 [Candidatus Omnitrophica bacterium]|nr:hypothetical protein [Candidatus Omnitrophota bacterium]
MCTNKTLTLIILGAFIGYLCFFGFPSHLYAQLTDERKNDIQQAVDLFLKEKKKNSGSLDLFDESINKVRNLNYITLHMDTLADKGGRYDLQGDLRDLGSGDIVDVKIEISKSGNDALTVREIKIIGVKQKAAEKASPAIDQKFTNLEVVAAIAAYIEKMSKFGGTFGLVDPKTEKYRQLKLIKIDEKIRNFGILYISTVEFEDVDSKEKIFVDMTFYNKDGKLDMKSVRIIKVMKP